MNEDEIKFRAYLLVLNSDFPTHRKTEAMEELLKINNKQQKEIEEEHKNWKELLHEYGVKCQEIEELKKITTLYNSYEVPNARKIVLADSEFFEKGYFKKNYISKVRIRVKIKELEGQEDWYIEHKSLDDLYGRIDLLKELLGE